MPQMDNFARGGFDFSGAFGDGGTAVQWRRESANLGAGANTYTKVVAVANQRLIVQITPKANSETNDPFSTPVISFGSAVVRSDVGISLAPDLELRTQEAAKTYCQNQVPQARLPTVEELQVLFVNATPSPSFAPSPGYITNAEMCSKYGWPLKDQCGGGASFYENIYWAHGAALFGKHANLTNGWSL